MSLRLKFIQKGLLLAGLFACNSGQAQTHFAGIRLYTENDFLSPVGQNTDDNYTGGIRIEFITNLANKLFSHKILNPLHWEPVQQSFSFTVTAFTPNDLADSNIVYGERPYASYQAWNIGAAYVKGNNRLSYELSIGAMGKSLAGDAQKKIHGEHWFGTTRPVPQGWNNQIANGGAFAINLRVDFEHTLFSTDPGGGNFQWLSGSWLHELNLGQYMINYMQGVRLYFFNINHNIPSDEDIPIIPAWRDGQPKMKKFEFYCFFTPRLKAVIHNATLTGQLLTRESAYTLPYPDVNKAVLEYDAGFQVRLYFLRLGYSLYGRSREYNGEATAFHNWGGVYIGCVARW